MATDTTPKQNDTQSTKPAETPKAAQAKRTPKPRAKTAAKSRSRTRATARSRARKPAARASRSQATAPTGARQLFAGAIDAQEKTLTAFADYQARAAELSQIPGASAIAGAQAQLLRGATDVYVSAARSLLK